VRVVGLVEVQLNGLREVGQGLIDALPLTGYVNLEALRDIPVLLLVHRCREDLRHVLRIPAAPSAAVQDPAPTTAPQSATGFTILRIPSPGVAGPLEVVYIDQLVDIRYLEDRPDLVAHDKHWHRLSAAALSPEDTPAFMRDVTRDY
jgi:Domain of unknown function (DUF5753)